MRASNEPAGGTALAGAPRSQTVLVARRADVTPGAPFPVRVEGVDLVVVSCAGEARVFQGACPHQGASLASGSISGGVLTCAAHGWAFDCLSGRKLGDDGAGAALKSFTVLTHGDEILVGRDEVLAWKEERARRAPTRATRTIDELPGPRGLPLLGNLLQLAPSRLHLVLEGWCRTYGPLYVFRMARRPVLAVGDAGLVNEVLRNRPAGYRRWTVIEDVLQEMGVTGVFSAEGEDWRRQRLLAVQGLNSEHLSRFFETLSKVTGRLRARWERSAAEGRAVDVRADLMRYTVDVTTNLAFGHDLNTLECEGGAVQRHLEKIFPLILRRISAPFPYWRHVKLPGDRAFERSLRAIEDLVGEFVARARARMEPGPDGSAPPPSNFLEALLVARRGEGPRPDGADEIFGNVLTMLLAGEDTTANSMAWMTCYMARLPEVMARMQEEADRVLGEERALVRFRDAEELRYIEAVAHEAMRLKAVAPLIYVEANRDEELGGFRLPAGTRLALLTRHCALQDASFAEADRFRPERWLEAPGGGSRPGHDGKAFLPFGAGPRYCPGRNLALLEVKAVMAMLCRNFTLELADPSAPVRERFAFTMMPEGLSVRLKAR